MGQFTSIFTNMNWASGVLLTIGLVLCIIEIYVPGFGVFGIFGSIATGLGVIIRLIQGISMLQFFMLLLVIIFILLIAVAIMIVLIKFGFMEDNGLLETSEAKDEDYKAKKFKKLSYRYGKATTNIIDSGKVKIKGKIYNARSKEGVISSGKVVKIVGLEDNQLIVKKFWE